MGFWRRPGHRVPGSERVRGHQRLWLWRVARGARPDRNPLRRRADRLETYLIAGLFLAGGAGAPFAAQAASQASFSHGLHVRAEQLASRYQVPAVLTGDADSGGYSLTSNVPAQATWTAVDGTSRAGVVPAPSGTRSGGSVIVWTLASGELTGPPLTVAEVADQADAALVGAITGVVVACVAGALAIRQLIDRRRMAAWDDDWRATAPAWNRQR
jgi:hypothetical protein